MSLPTTATALDNTIAATTTTTTITTLINTSTENDATVTSAQQDSSTEAVSTAPEPTTQPSQLSTTAKILNLLYSNGPDCNCQKVEEATSGSSTAIKLSDKWIVTLAIIGTFILIAIIVLVPMVRKKRGSVLFCRQSTNTTDSNTTEKKQPLVVSDEEKYCGRCDDMEMEKMALVPDVRIDSPRSVSPNIPE